MIAFALTACAGGRQPLERGALSPDTMIVLPVQNLSGRPLKIPEIYLGDAVGKAAELEVESISLADLAEAGVYTRLSGLGYRAELEQNAARLGAPARYEVHSAVTLLDFDDLRGTGRFRMGVVVMLVDAQSQREVARGHARREFQLFDHAPDEVGALGTDRFIERRLQIFTESLAGEAVDAGGF